MLKEDLLHFIWKYRLFKQEGLKTQDNSSLQIIQTGLHNTNAGADFQNAKIRIDDTVLAGNVEIHVYSSDWKKHGHQHDVGYDNTILHVVYEVDSYVAKTTLGHSISTLELKGFVEEKLLDSYQYLMQSKQWIPCAKLLPELDKSTLFSFIERIGIERLEQKINILDSYLKESQNNWEQVLYRMLARYMGGTVNREPFELLSEQLPLHLIEKYRDERQKVEALIFGTSGFLEGVFTDDYPKSLAREFTYLKRLHGIEPMPHEYWKFLRIRPANFPTVRLAQFAALMVGKSGLFSCLIAADKFKEVEELFQATADAYWAKHVVFDELGGNGYATIGKTMRHNLLINAVVPLLYAYGRYKNEEAICERAISWQQQLPAEVNTIMKSWKMYGMETKTAFDSQALLQLKQTYCTNFRCLDCALGRLIVCSI